MFENEQKCEEETNSLNQSHTFVFHEIGYEECHTAISSIPAMGHGSPSCFSGRFDELHGTVQVIRVL